jgi:hypothetical protein
MNKNLIVMLLLLTVAIGVFFIFGSSDKENVTPTTSDYVGMTVAEAQAQARAAGVPFRVVIQDGQPLPITTDSRLGLINATVKGGVVTEYSVENDNTVSIEDTYCSDLKSRTVDSGNSALISEIASGAKLVSGQVIAGCVYAPNESYDGWAPFEGQVGFYELKASDGTSLAVAPLFIPNQNWMEAAMNNQSIKFQSTLKFEQGLYTAGELVFNNENASGEPERVRQIIVPVTF